MKPVQWVAVVIVAIGLPGAIPADLIAQRVPTWRLTPDGRIGWGQPFTRILEILPAANGSVVVADDRNQEIYVFDRDGSYLHNIGRMGEGPGEFVRLRAAGLLADTVWVIDSDARRTTLFALDGTLLTTIRNDAGAWLTAMVPNGALGSAATPLGSPGAFRDERLPVLLMTRAGETVDTLAWTPSRHRTFVLGPSSSGSYIIGDQPFSDAGLTIVAPGAGLLFVVDRSVTATPDNARFRVMALRTSGDTLWDRTYTYTPRRLPRSRGDSLLAARAPAILRAGYSRSDVRDALFIPDHYPPITSGIATSDGTLWLRREEGGDTVVYWVVGPDGELDATVTVPAHVTIKAASHTTAWGVTRDEYDVPSVTRYRIDR